MNLGEVILTLLWKSGASESATLFCYYFKYLLLTVQVSFAHRVCVCQERERVTAAALCVCARMCERDKRSHNPRLVCKHIWASSLCLSRDCFPLRLELIVKLRTLSTVFTFILKAKAQDYGKGCCISDAACDARPITIHCVSWPIRADCACRKEGLCRKWSVWERRGIEDLQ